MARYDVFEVADAGLVLDIQSDILLGIATRLVVPLWRLEQAPRKFPRLNPEFEIKSGRYVMATTLITAVPTAILSSKIASLREHQDSISSALDMVFYGF